MFHHMCHAAISRLGAVSTSLIAHAGRDRQRAQFVQAAWVVLVKPKNWARNGLKSWIEAVRKRLHHNVLASALVNKLARIVWSVLAHGCSSEASKLALAVTQPT
jgi:transposase